MAAGAALTRPPRAPSILCYADFVNLQSALPARLANRAFAYAYYFYRTCSGGRART